jgi:hypothetical protein
MATEQSESDLERSLVGEITSKRIVKGGTP